MTSNERRISSNVLTARSSVNGARRLLVIGGGYTGQRVAAAARGQGLEALLTCRDGARGQRDPRWLTLDCSQGLLPAAAALAGVSHVLVTVPPDPEAGDPNLQALLPLLRDLPLDWLGYLSTTGVYGDSAGAWVDEAAPLHPVSPRSQARVAAEQAWRDSGLPVQIFRLPAIYGPGRCPFQGLEAGTSRLIHKRGQVFSRVHVDDIAGALLHCLNLPPQQRPPVLNVADDCPCPSTETLGFAAHLLGRKLPPVEPFEAIAEQLSPMARSFWRENRRASNRLLCQGLGYGLRYPSYREGFRASLAEERWGAQPVASPESAT